jgi:DNA-binding SARP family transcriptional activator/TolB-like protein
MSFRLLLLGSARLVDANGATLAFPGKAVLLAARLALSGEGYSISRAEAADLLWEEASGAAAALNLRQLLVRVRNRQDELGLDLFQIDPGHVRLNPDATAIDVMQFQRLITSEDDCVRELCSVYGGDFLAGLHVEGEMCRQWCEVHRTRLRQSFVLAVEGQLLARSELAPDDIATSCNALLDVDPYNETACRGLLQVLGHRGHVQEALSLFETFQKRLRTDLGVDPGEATVNAADVIRRSRRSGPWRQQSFPRSDSVAASRPAPRVVMLPPVLEQHCGMAGELASALVVDASINLCGLKTVAVIAPHTAWQIAQDDSEARLRQCAIDYVVESRLSLLLGEPALLVQLYRTACRTIVWAERFHFDLLGTSERYRELTTRIAKTLASNVERIELARFDTTVNPVAYANFLQGQRQIEGMDLPSIRRARKLFQASLAECPQFAPAVSGLARTCHLEWLMLGRREPELLDHSIRLSNKAIELDPVDARGYRELGVASLFARRFDESINALRRAQATSPHFADALADLADTLSHSGQPEEGLVTMTRAIELNPLPPDIYWWTAGGTNYLLGRYEDAIECLSRMSDTTPANRLIAATWAMLGNGREAEAYVRQVLEEHPNFRIEDWLAMVPFRDATQRRHYEAGLRAAGFH